MLCDLIPHAGKMCLIDAVLRWDEMQIICTSNTHQDLDNPLRNQVILPASSLIEYGAQTMAIHGALLANSPLNNGYLIVLRDAKIILQDLSQVNYPLCIEAQQLIKSGGSMVYQFNITANEVFLASGKVTVISDNNL